MNDPIFTHFIMIFFSWMLRLDIIQFLSLHQNYFQLSYLPSVRDHPNMAAELMRLYFGNIQILERMLSNTAPTHNKRFSHNKHALFALRKMCLFGEEKDFGKINSLYFSTLSRLRRIFYYFSKIV